MVGEEIEIDEAPSSLAMVPAPVAVRIVAPEALLRRTATVSCGSTVVSPVTDTAIVLRVSFAAKVSVPPASTV